MTTRTAPEKRKAPIKMRWLALEKQKNAEEEEEEDFMADKEEYYSEEEDINAKNHTRCLFIDFSSAFNTISPTTLCNQLQDTSLNPAVLNLVYDFMTNRSQKVLTEQGLSLALTTSVGTPQSCVISPLLFSNYVQHMPKPSSGNFHLIKYADDTVFVELLSKNDVSQMDIAAHNLAG